MTYAIFSRSFWFQLFINGGEIAKNHSKGI